MIPTTTDLITMCAVSAGLGAVTVTIILLIWALYRDCRDARERRDHYIEGRTIRPGKL